MSVSDSRERLDALVFRYLERVEAGDEPAAILEELCSEDPDLAASLRRGVDRLRDVNLHPGPSRDALPEEIGGFRLLRSLGAGGMGVVYLAQQEKPSRRVALKLVHPGQLYFAGARERFAREIETVARLSHPGIAAVYESGESDGVPWFTQEYVRGASLEALLRSTPPRELEKLSGRDLRGLLADALPEDEEQGSWDEVFFEGTWVEVCLRIVRQVADALQHAHERGVLHRDVKPSNVILTPAGRAVLVDFGLASMAGTDGLTRSGAQLGSLTYMSPEQLEGQTENVGAATDVYSLGVTLYELLTLRAPYASPSVVRLQSLILEGTTTAPGRWNPAVSKDASVVCLCAMERDVGRRYSTAASLAADLANVLAQRPILARPVGPIGRLWRRCQRHPAAAVMAVLLLVVAPTLMWIQSALSNHEQRRLNDQLLGSLQRESDAHARTEVHFQSAIDAVESVMRETGVEDLANAPGLSLARLDIANRALEIFSALEDDRPGDPRLQQRRAVLLRSRADALQDLERFEESLLGYEEALDLFDDCVELAAPSSGLYHDIATVHNNRAMLLERLLRTREALEEFEVAAGWLRRAAELAGTRQSLDADLLLAELNVARLLFDLGDWQQATVAARVGRDRARELVAAQPAEWAYQHRLFVALSTLGRGQQQAGEQDRAIESFTEALEAADSALALAPINFRVRVGRAEVLSDLGLAWAWAGRSQEARTHLELSRASFDVLTSEYPSLEGLASLRIETISRLAFAHQLAGETDLALEWLEDVIVTRVAHARREPSDIKLGLEAALAHGNAANVLINDTVRGPKRYERALEILELGLEFCPHPDTLLDFSESLRGQVAFLVCMQSICLANLGELEFARERLEALDALGLESPEPSILRADAWAEWALSAARVEGLDAARFGRTRAMNALEAAIDSGYRDRDRLETSQALLALQGEPRFDGLLARLNSAR